MKTIFRTNRPQNKYIGFSLLLLIAVFGLFIGGVKPPTGEVAESTIGGNGSVVVPAPTPVILTYSAEIGGQQIPRDTHPLSYVLNAEIGGPSVPRTSPVGIGGNGLPAPTLPLPVLEGNDESQIGGTQSVPQPPRPFMKKSGHQFVCKRSQSVFDYNEDPALLEQGESCDGLTIQRGLSDTLVSANEIGGSGTVTPKPTLPIGEIGGTQGAPRPFNEQPGKYLVIGGQCVPNSSPWTYSASDIGGTGTPKTSLPITTDESEMDEIGGTQGAPRTQILADSGVFLDINGQQNARFCRVTTL